MPQQATQAAPAAAKNPTTPNPTPKRKRADSTTTPSSTQDLNAAAFMAFKGENEAKVAAHNPQLTEGDRNKLLAQLWAAATEEEKKPYFASPAKDASKQDRKKRVKKDPRAPKRNMSAFLYFSNVRRAEVKKSHPNLTFSELAKVLSDLWHNASSQERGEYLERAKQDKHRYFKEKKTFDDEMKALGIVMDDNSDESLEDEGDDPEYNTTLQG